MEEKVGLISEKRTDFSGLLKNLFGYGSSQSDSLKESILNSKGISKKDEKILLRSSENLENREKRAEKIFNHEDEQPEQDVEVTLQEQPENPKITKDVEVTLQKQPENSQQAKLISEHDEREH